MPANPASSPSESSGSGGSGAPPSPPVPEFRPDSVTKLQFVDGLAGPVLCLLASCLERLLPCRLPAEAPRSILFIKLSEQGATVLAGPALREAVRRVGRECVYFVTFTGNRDILDLMDVIPRQNVLELENSSVWAFLRGLIALFRRFRHLRPEAAIDLDFFTRASALLTWASGAPRRVGLHAYFGEGPYRGELMTHRCRYNPHWHTAKFFLALVHALDQAPQSFPAWQVAIDNETAFRWPKARLPEEARRVAEKLVMGTLRLPSIPVLVLLNANCSDLVPLRKWMPDRYVALARLLLERHAGVSVLFTGAKSEAAETDALAARVGSPRCGSIAGRTTLPQLLAVYDLAAVLVTNDSGPVHFASLTQVKTVALFGPETPALFGPVVPDSVALTASLACSPCVSAQNSRQSSCRDNLCMRAIGVETVYAAVASRLPVTASTSAPSLYGPPQI